MSTYRITFKDKSESWDTPASAVIVSPDGALLIYKKEEAIKTEPDFIFATGIWTHCTKIS